LKLLFLSLFIFRKASINIALTFALSARENKIQKTQMSGLKFDFQLGFLSPVEGFIRTGERVISKQLFSSNVCFLSFSILPSRIPFCHLSCENKCSDVDE